MKVWVREREALEEGEEGLDGKNRGKKAGVEEVGNGRGGQGSDGEGGIC